MLGRIGVRGVVGVRGGTPSAVPGARENALAGGGERGGERKGTENEEFGLNILHILCMVCIYVCMVCVQCCY